MVWHRHQKQMSAVKSKSVGDQSLSPNSKTRSPAKKKSAPTFDNYLQPVTCASSSSASSNPLPSIPNPPTSHPHCLQPANVAHSSAGLFFSSSADLSTVHGVLPFPNFPPYSSHSLELSAALSQPTTIVSHFSACTSSTALPSSGCITLLAQCITFS